tara:strand:+ start:2813 stop:3076 length:264 start_codon:yes stop_codon:yes gene_type:complete
MNTKCKYREFLHKKLKQGRISGKFYKFLYRTFPHRLTYRPVTVMVTDVLAGRIKEEVAIHRLKTHGDHKSESKRQKSLVKDMSKPNF